MVQSFLFVLGMVALFALVPLSTWAATGSFRQAWRSLRAYAFMLALLFGVPALLGMAAGIIAGLAA